MNRTYINSYKVGDIQEDRSWMVSAFRHSIHQVCPDIQDTRKLLWSGSPSIEEDVDEGNVRYEHNQDDIVLLGNG